MLAYSMTSLEQLSQLRYLVVGLGKSGFSVARFLSEQNFNYAVQDDRELPPFKTDLMKVDADCNIIQRPLSTELMCDYDCVVVSPGVSIQTPMFTALNQQQTRIIGDIELFALFNDKPVIAITGSNGKTTVTTLMGEVIKNCSKSVAVGGNIGTAALDLLATDAEFVVLELSSFQLETTYSLKPVVSVILNVTEDHMDRYADFAGYAEAKQRIHSHSECVIENRQDQLTYVTSKTNDEARYCYSFGLSEPTEDQAFGLRKVNDCTYFAHYEDLLLDTDQLKLKGHHNWANCLAVLAMAKAIGLPLEPVIAAIKNFAGISHRYEWVATKNAVTWINDSKATNPGATLAAIEGTASPIVLIVGGQSKQADISVLNEAIKAKVKTAIVMGEDAHLFATQWQPLCDIKHVGTMSQAVALANTIAKEGDCVLLSPACASFDQYSGYEARGDDFKQCVTEVLEQ